MSIYTGDFWRAASERSVKSLAYGLGAILIGNGTGLLDTDWVGVLSVAGMGALLSILGSIASDASTGGTGPSLTSAETMSSRVAVTAPADAIVQADVTMPSDEACPEDHPETFGSH